MDIQSPPGRAGPAGGRPRPQTHPRSMYGPSGRTRQSTLRSGLTRVIHNYAPYTLLRPQLRTRPLLSGFSRRPPGPNASRGAFGTRRLTSRAAKRSRNSSAIRVLGASNSALLRSGRLRRKPGSTPIVPSRRLVSGGSSKLPGRRSISEDSSLDCCGTWAAASRTGTYGRRSLSARQSRCREHRLG